MPEQRDEMVRGFLSIDKRFDRIEKMFDGFVGRGEYDEAQRHTDSRFSAIERDVKENKDAVGRVAEREDDRRNLRTQAYIGPIVSGIVVGITVAILLAVVGVGG